MYSDPRYTENRYSDPRYMENRYSDPRYAEPKYAEPRYMEPRYIEYKYPEPRYSEAGNFKMDNTKVDNARMNSVKMDNAGINNTKMDNAQCPDASGTMPSCAPLAVPYVPFQQRGVKKYNPAEALNNGTLYPGLNLPFHLKVDAVNVVGSPLSELQALDFVAHELALYLDTHPDDNEAFELYKQYTAMATEARKQYTAVYGPLTHHQTPESKSYAWINDPWPWNNTVKGWEK